MFKVDNESGISFTNFVKKVTVLFSIVISILSFESFILISVKFTFLLK